MKSQVNQEQKNPILFVGRIRLPVNDNQRTQLIKLERVLVIQLNGAGLYKVQSSSASTNVASNFNREKNLNLLSDLQNPISSFPILPETEIYQLQSGDGGIEQYLAQLRLTIDRDRQQHVCLYCNNRQNVMFPIFFQSKQAGMQFHAAVVVCQLFKQYSPQLQKIKQEKRLSYAYMNIRLLQSLGESVARSEFVIDPENLSVLQLQKFELKIIKQTIQKFANKSSKLAKSAMQLSSIKNDTPMVQFALRLRYFIVDPISLSYLQSIISEDIMRVNVKQFDVSGCGITDKILNVVLTRGNQLLSKSNIPISFDLALSYYQNLIKLDLSNNQLTDICFISLSIFVQYTPNLTDLHLNGNRIKLLSTEAFRRGDKQNDSKYQKLSFSSSMRMSTGFNPTAINRSEPLFIQFLLSIQHIPLNYLNLDNNLIEEPDLIVEYLIEGSNVPIKYLSLKNNKFSEVDKIRMAKLIISELKYRDQTEQLPTLDFGRISVVDEEVYQYLMLLKQKTSQLQLNQNPHLDTSNRRSTRQISKLSMSLGDLKRFGENQQNMMKVSLTLNKQWELCDQTDLLEVRNLYKRRKTATRRSQMVSNMLMSNTGNVLSPNKSEPNLGRNQKYSQPEPVTPQTLKPTIQLLKQAFSEGNYSAIQLYKQLLVEYNSQLYHKKVSPLFKRYEDAIKEQKQNILRKIDRVINFNSQSSQNVLSQNKLNSKLDVLISILFRKRIQYHPSQSVILYEGQQFEEEIAGPHCRSVFTFLMYLKHKRDEKIQQLIQSKYDPMKDISRMLHTKLQDYYQLFSQQLCDDDYRQVIEDVLVSKPICGKELRAAQSSGPMQKQINEIIKYNYLAKCQMNCNRHHTYNQVNQDQILLCKLEPKLMASGYLIKYHTTPRINKAGTILNKVHSTLTSAHPIKPQPISRSINNILDFISRNDIIVAPNACINPYITPAELSLHQGIKLAYYNHEYEQSLAKFSQLVIAFMKFLQHSPYRMLAQTLQYLNYLINIVLSEEDPLNSVSLADEFYLQLMTFNANPDPQTRATQVSPAILSTLVQFCSLYLPHSESIQTFVMGHVLRAEMSINMAGRNESKCRMLKSKETRYTRKQDQLPPETVAYLFNNAGKASQNLGIPVYIYYQGEQVSDELEYHDLQKVALQLHLLTTIPELLQCISDSGIVSRWEQQPSNDSSGRSMSKNRNWSLFVCNRESNKTCMMIPGCQQVTNIYSLLRQGILSPENGKNYLLAKQLVTPIRMQLACEDTRKVWYKNVYKGFKEHGALLSMINENAHVVSVIVQSIVSHLLLTNEHKLTPLLAHSVDKRKSALFEICDVYVDKLQLFCPKGTAVTLSSQDKLYIESQVSKAVLEVLESLTKAVQGESTEAKQRVYWQMVHRQIKQFEVSCRLISNCTEIADEANNQYLLVTNHGLVHINRVIYVQALHWSDVYDIKFGYDDASKQIRGIQILYREKQANKSMTVPVAGQHDSLVFINACILMIKNIAITFVEAVPSDLYKHFSHSDTVVPISASNANNYDGKYSYATIWQELEQQIKYSPPAPKSTKKQQVQNHDDLHLQQQNKMMQPPLSLNSSAEFQKQTKNGRAVGSENAEQQQNKKSIWSGKQGKIQEQIQLNSIVSQVRNQGSELDEKRKTLSEIEDVVVTNFRKSGGRRELPRRRSSREK